MPGSDRSARLWVSAVVICILGCGAAGAADEPAVVLEAERCGAGTLSFSPDGRRLLSGGDHQDNSYLWDLVRGQPLARVEGCGTILYSAAFAPGGRYFVTAGLDPDRSRWVIATWDGRTARRIGQLPDNSGWAAAISPDGRTLAVVRLGRHLDFYMLPDLQPIGAMPMPLPDTAQRVAYSPDGARLAAWVGSSVWVGHARGGEPGRPWDAGSKLRSLTFTRDGRAVVAGDEGGTVACRDADSGRSLWSRPAHDGKPVRGMAVSPDGRLAASGAEDGRIRLWDLGAGGEVGAIDIGRSRVQAVAFSPDGTRLAAGHGSDITVWTVAQRGRPSPRNPARARAVPRPKDTVRFGRHSYALIDEPVTWHVAQRRCQAMGGHLATFETPAERDRLLELIRGRDTSAWVGASDEEEEGKWVWVTGEPVARELRADWGLDNHENAQHSLCYWKNTGVFDDNFSGTRMPFVCEWND